MTRYLQENCCFFEDLEDHPHECAFGSQRIDVHCGMLRIVVFFCLSFVVPSSSSQLHRHRGLRGDLAARAIRARVTPDARKKTATSDGLMSLAWNCRYFLRFKAYCEMVEGLLSSSLRWAHAAGFHPSLPQFAEIHSLAYAAHKKLT